MVAGASLQIEEFAPDDPRCDTFDSLGEQLDPAGRGHELILPAARCLLAWRHGRPAARLTYEVAEDLQGAGGAAGIMGHYEAVDAEAGVALLRHCRELLARAGVTSVIGPMNGSPWMRYRLALPPGPGDPCWDPPTFFTEPRNPVGYAGHFLEAGFTVVGRYESRIVPRLPVDRPRAEGLGRRVRAAGITIRPLDLDRWEQELWAMYEFSGDVFAANPCYRPIGFPLFREIYCQIRPVVDPELIRLAEDPEGRVVGFVAAVPDRLCMERERATRLVLKTLATAPEVRRLGLGACLADEIHRLAQEMGYRSVVHALMHQENESLRLSHRYGSQLFRRYVLFGWQTDR